MVYEFVFLVICLVLAYISLKKKRIQYFTCSDQFLQESYHEIDQLPPSYISPNVNLTPLNVDKIILIQSRSQLTSAIEILNKSSYLGVDIEESREYSYLGYICLIQIATEDSIFLIDTLKLRKYVLDLKPIFINNKIVKIFHGSHNDTQWLFRDFGIICVNAFDTYLAAGFLGLKKQGLNYLWERYCNYIMASEYKKKMQTSRWDSRPLTKEQIVYGAQDACYLIYLMQEMTKELSGDQLLNMRIETNKICKKYSLVELIEPKSMVDILKKYANQAIDSQAVYIFTEIYKLREELAKAIDKPTEKVCPMSALVSIALEKPTDRNQILQACTDNPLVARQSMRIVQIVNLGLDQNLEILSDGLIYSQSRKDKKQERYKQFLEKYTIKHKVFENCQILKPDGELLCYADSK